ncbi:MAG: sensor histidine kinase [Terriglobales bacterium]
MTGEQDGGETPAGQPEERRGRLPHWWRGAGGGNAILHDPLPPAAGEAAASAERRRYFHLQRQILLLLGLGCALAAKAAEPHAAGWGWTILAAVWLGYSCLFALAQRWWPRGTPADRAVAAYYAGELVLLTVALRHLGGSGLTVLLFGFVVVYAQLGLPRRPGYALTAAAAAGWVLAAWHAAARAGHAGGHAMGWEWLAAGAGAVVFCGYFSAEFARVLTGVGRALGAANRDLRAAARELRQHRHHLEELVAQRTAELAAAGDELRRANEDLRRLNQAKSHFLANVSHELRTPLTSIRSFSELLLAYPDEAPETRQEFLKVIKSETLRLTRLINDVLDWSSIEAGQMTWREQPVNLAAAARTAAAGVRGWAEAKGLKLRVVTEPEGGPPGTVLRGDFDRLVQVAANLLSNAIKFTPAGEIEIGVRTTAPRAGAAAEIWMYVRDTGPGIAPEDLPAIFESFRQGGHPLTGKPQGTGLGLAICREIVGHYRGRIWAENDPGGGCTFYCVFPAAAASVAAAAP